MGRRLSLDTSVLVGLERGTLSPSVLRPDDDICVSLVAIDEYMVGVELARVEHRPRMRQFLDKMCDAVAVLPFDQDILETHVKLAAWTYRQGRPRGQHDLMIAATALATDRLLLTCDRKARFEELPGLNVQVVVLAEAR